ncbi:MAG: hypothetical protein MUP70_07660, partial [Candidatus Aminicenantes bacterium]|nr:hypothetical protein [Candidatus Aminicenantes bacterium]
IFGGEESASLAVKDHLPEKDGIMAGLLLVEMLSVYGNSLSRQIEEMFREYVRRVCLQRSLPMTPARDKKLRKLIKSPPSKLSGRRVINIETIEGIKLDFENDDWLLLRFSGTEPIIRLYAEAGDKTELGRLIEDGLELVT